MIYFLSRYTIVNNDGIHTGINYNNMHNELRFSKTLSRRLIHLYQVTVSSESCLFIKLLAKDISHYYPQYERIVDLLTFTDDDGRMVISCYLTMDILLKHMSIGHTPIMIQQIDQKRSIQGVTASISYQLSHKSFHKLSLPQIKDNHPCIMFRGIGSFSNNLSLSEKLSVLGIKKTLLASTARHPQYPGRNLESLKDDPFSMVLLKNISLQEELYLKIIRDEFLNMKKWSLTHGCCMESPATFFVTHIFCGNSSHYINTGYNQTMDYMDRIV